jgi:predicted membrane protein
MQDHVEGESQADQSIGGEYKTSRNIFGCQKSGRPLGPRFIFAIFLIIAGTLLFLSNIGLFPVRDIWAYWPLLLAALGGSKFSNSRSSSGRVWGIILVVGSVLILACNLGLLHVREDVIWPVLLIGFGFLVLTNTLESRKRSRSALGFPTGPVALSDVLLKDWAVLGNVKRKVETDNFLGGELISFFGSVDIDLRRARISPATKSVTIEANAVFGAVKLRLPGNWRVNVKGIGILGSFEDKTIPPGTTVDTPIVVISGYSVFGAVEIED